MNSYKLTVITNQSDEVEKVLKDTKFDGFSIDKIENCDHYLEAVVQGEFDHKEVRVALQCVIREIKNAAFRLHLSAYLPPVVEEKSLITPEWDLDGAGGVDAVKEFYDSGSDPESKPKVKARPKSKKKPKPKDSPNDL